MPRQTAAGVDVAPVRSAFDHGVKDLFDLELAFGLQVGGAGAAFADDAAVGVGEEGDGLGPARIDPQDVHPTSLSASLANLASSADVAAALARGGRHVRLSVPMFRSLRLRDRALSLLLVAATASFRAAAPEQTRALWVTRTTLTSPESIRQMVAAAQAGGFNTLLVQVRGRGDAYYSGTHRAARAGARRQAVVRSAGHRARATRMPPA